MSILSESLKRMQSNCRPRMTTQEVLAEVDSIMRKHAWWIPSYKIFDSVIEPMYSPRNRDPRKSKRGQRRERIPKIH